MHGWTGYWSEETKLVVRTLPFIQTRHKLKLRIQRNHQQNISPRHLVQIMHVNKSHQVFYRKGMQATHSTVLHICEWESSHSRVGGEQESRGVNGPILADTRSKKTAKRKGKREWDRSGC